jgi:tetratricopeptide (TPR) repeat protein
VKFLDSVAGRDKLAVALKAAVANGYSSVEQPAKAVEIMEKMIKEMPAPKGNDMTDPATKSYRIAQLELARTYRLAKKYAEADKYLDTLIGTAKDKGPYYSSLVARKEKAYLLEDQGKFRDAVQMWMTLAKQFGGDPIPAYPAKDDTASRKRATYFDLFFEAQRSSAKAYTSLNIAKNPKNKEVVDKGYANIGRLLAEVEAKNPDISDELKEKIRELLDEQKAIGDSFKTNGGKI